MNLFGKDVSQLTVDDFALLVSTRAPETRTLEYKEALPGQSDADKTEFLADVSSLANTSGGLIIFGIREVEGSAAELKGVAVPDVDAEVLRLDAIVRSGLDPRLPGLLVRGVPLATGRCIIAVSVPLSWQKPHMLASKASPKFYARGSAGKYPMDTTEIRSAVLASEGLSTRIRQFHLLLSSDIAAGKGLLPGTASGLVVAHLLPITSLQSPHNLDVSFLEKDQALLVPLDGWISSARYNVDGYATAYTNAKGQLESYAQLSRSGVLEAASIGLFSLNHVPPVIPSVTFEVELTQFLTNGLTIYKDAGIDPPYSAHCSLLRVRGYSLAPPRDRFPTRGLEHVYGKGVDRDEVHLPDLYITANDPAASSAISRPWFDALWNAAGWPRSYNYDENGNWLLKVRVKGA